MINTGKDLLSPVFKIFANSSNERSRAQWMIILHKWYLSNRSKVHLIDWIVESFKKKWFAIAYHLFAFYEHDFASLQRCLKAIITHVPSDGDNGDSSHQVVSWVIWMLKTIPSHEQNKPAIGYVLDFETFKCILDTEQINNRDSINLLYVMFHTYGIKMDTTEEVIELISKNKYYIPLLWLLRHYSISFSSSLVCLSVYMQCIFYTI